MVLALQWTIIDIVTPFLWLPIYYTVWFLILIATVISIILLGRKDRAKKLQFYLPVVAFICVILAAEFVPFTRIWLKINFLIYRADREKVAEDIFSGQLRPNVSYNRSLIALPPAYKGLSMGGGEVIFESFGNTQGVYYFTYRGILGASSGYLFMSSDVVPSAHDIVELRKVAPRWYFVGTE